jgi:hypothetical protein
MTALLLRIIERLYNTTSDRERTALYAFAEEIRAARPSLDDAALAELELRLNTIPAPRPEA